MGASPPNVGSSGRKNVVSPDGSAWAVGGDLGIDEDNGGALWLRGKQLKAADTVDLPNGATITPAAGSANVSLVTIQVLDASGHGPSAPSFMNVWLSDAASGAGQTGTTASGAVAAGAAGTDWQTITAKKALYVQTNASGQYILSITDTAKTGFYVCCELPNGKIVVSSQLVAGNYG